MGWMSRPQGPSTSDRMGRSLLGRDALEKRETVTRYKRWGWSAFSQASSVAAVAGSLGREACVSPSLSQRQ